MPEQREYINGLLIVTLLISLGASVTYTIQETGDRAVCRNGIWDQINATHYKCTVNDRIEICHHLSSTSKTCYLGQIIEPDPKGSCGDYFCYQGKDYCRLEGNLNNPRIPRAEVC